MAVGCWITAETTHFVICNIFFEQIWRVCVIRIQGADARHILGMRLGDVTYETVVPSVIRSWLDDTDSSNAVLPGECFQAVYAAATFRRPDRFIDGWILDIVFSIDMRVGVNN